MVISFIVAASENNAIGRKNGLPWTLPEDMKFFRRTTLTHPVIMGRKTYESLERPLPGRENIILTRNKDAEAPAGALIYEDVNAALAYLQEKDADETFIIGGGQIFADTMQLADRIYITRVHTVIDDADTFFPEIDHTHWKLVWEEPHPADTRHQYAYTFQKYERVEL